MIIRPLVASRCRWRRARRRRARKRPTSEDTRRNKSQDKGQLAVSEEDGHFLRVLVATSKTKRALEIGGASGYSAIWIGMGLRETGGSS